MGGLRASLRITAKSVRARFNTDCQKRQNSSLKGCREIWVSMSALDGLVVAGPDRI
jgi:hypothetical protein